jgi:glycerol-3-phosphate dehydrogenase
MTTQRYDVLIIGAGVVGSLIARTLARYQLDILLLDMASDVGEGTTKANTAIVHAGYDAKAGTLKARFNVEGNRLYDQVCSELQVDFDRCGTYVVGVGQQDRSTLEQLQVRGAANGVPGLLLLDRDEMLRREPAITPQTVGALFAATGGIVDPFDLCIAAAENAVQNGATCLLDTHVTGFLRDGETITGVETTRGPIAARWTIIAAGLWADDLMQQAGLKGFRIAPRKGEYFLLDKVAAERVHSVLFPCPTPESKGILVTRTIHGNVMLGPNSAPTDDKEDLTTTPAGLDEVLTGARKLVPTLDARQVIRTFAGLRATGSTGDFVIALPPQPQGLLVLAGIESPGLASSPAIALHVRDMLQEAGLPLVERPDYDPIRRRIPRFAALSNAEREALIAQDPRFAHVVCRCETVTEGELVAAMHRPIPARTYDGLKRRTRLGSGRCQGAFDLPLALGIMARELGVSPLELTKKGGDSRFVRRPTKEVGA